MTMLKLQSYDNVVFEVELAIAKRSVVMRRMIANLGEENLNEPIPLINIESDILEKVIEFATHHKNDPMPNDDRMDKKSLTEIPMTEWDKEFLTVDDGTLVKLFESAHYLGVDDLKHLICKKVENL